MVILYILFVGSIVNLCNCCYSIPPASRARSNVHEALGGAFTKRHHVDCGLSAIICKVPIFGALQVVSEPRFCRYPQVQSAYRITLPTAELSLVSKLFLLKKSWIDLSRSAFFSLPLCFSSLTSLSFESSLLPTSLSFRFPRGWTISCLLS
jgi:hypothetical protein